MTRPVDAGLTAAVLGPLMRSDTHRPRLTTYVGGFRTELSTASLANWSAKVAGLLVDELGCRPGDSVFVGVGPGWQTAPILLGTWWAGLVVSESDLPDAAAAFVPDAADPSIGAAEEVFVVSGHPLGAPSQAVAPHQRDFTTAVLPQADRFTPGRLPGDAPATQLPQGVLSVQEMLDRVARLAVPTGTRLISTTPWTLPDGVVGTLLAALAADGSLVQSDSTGPALLDQAAAERATATAGFEAPSLPRLS